VNCDIEGYECDFVWRDQRLIVETDGGAAHGTPGAKERDPIRDADLQIADWRVIRIPSMRLSRQPDAVEAQLRRLLKPAPAAPAAPHPR
jgi:very-short-patch-repair endonuclease